MPVPQQTVAEISAEMAKSSIPTVLIEGKTDALIFRRIQNRLGLAGFTFFLVDRAVTCLLCMSCSGRILIVALPFSLTETYGILMVSRTRLPM